MTKVTYKVPHRGNTRMESLQQPTSQLCVLPVNSKIETSIQIQNRETIPSSRVSGIRDTHVKLQIIPKSHVHMTGQFIRSWGNHDLTSISTHAWKLRLQGRRQNWSQRQRCMRRRGWKHNASYKNAKMSL